MKNLAKFYANCNPHNLLPIDKVYKCYSAEKEEAYFYCTSLMLKLRKRQEILHPEHGFINSLMSDEGICAASKQSFTYCIKFVCINQEQKNTYLTYIITKNYIYEWYECEKSEFGYVHDKKVFTDILNQFYS